MEEGLERVPESDRNRAETGKRKGGREWVRGERKGAKESKGIKWCTSGSLFETEGEGATWGAYVRSQWCMVPSAPFLLSIVVSSL